MLLFSNGGARKKKSKTAKKARVVKGRLSPPVDVRSRNSVPEFENLLKKGPLTIVLIYADWCGACNRFKENTWNDVLHMNNRTMNVGSVREDMIGATSLANAKISHYPSLLLVGTDKRPAEFVSPDGNQTNALPNQEKENLLKILKTPVDEVPLATNAKNLEVKTNYLQNAMPSPETSPLSLVNEPVEVASPMSEVEAQETLPTPTAIAMPPNTNLDLKTSIQNAATAVRTPIAKPIVGGSRMNVGGLFSALSEVAQKGLPAALLVSGTQFIGLKGKRKSSPRTRKARGRKRNQFGRFSRRR